MKEFHGISASPGIVISKAFLYNEESISVPRYKVKEEDIEHEIIRYKQATQIAADELKELKRRITIEHSEDEARFLDTHILMLFDPMFTDQIYDKLRKDRNNIEWVIQNVVEDLIEKLNASPDLYLRERSMDINDISKRSSTT